MELSCNLQYSIPNAMGINLHSIEKISGIILRHLIPSVIWRIPTSEKIIYLTFDDGPIPEVTPWVLETLKSYNAHATFFCVGNNARKYHDIFKNISVAGHAIGNHTMNHLNGWNTSDKKYFEDVDECNSYVPSDLFRPPYGKIKFTQIKFLKKKYTQLF